LKYQRRMKPIFADFVRIIYGANDYLDYADVQNKEKVKGMEKDMFIITHNQLERENEALKSKVNEYEAIYLSDLCNYLLLQGYEHNQIVILTFYVGQVLAIKKSLKNLTVAKVYEINTDKKTVSIPHPLNTVELLRAASVGLGMSPQETMSVAERLYMQGYISYPRTETTKYPANFDIKSVLQEHRNHNLW